MRESPVVNDAGVSEREAEVLDLLGEHLTNAEIAARLFISVRTVESHVSSLLRKLGAEDRRALAGLAAERSAAAATAIPRTELAEPPVLPVPVTSFVGRRAERAALAEALGQQRLVTAVGPGGVGKTRLALAVAGDVHDRYADGVWYVDLVPVTDRSMVGAAVAAALGFGEQLGRSLTDTVLARLADARTLLVLDNCEHLVDGVAELIERLLTACRGVSVLATSQVRLMLPFEQLFPVPGLSVAEADADAVELFIERAGLVGWSPQSPEDAERIAAVCTALDGSALAIELAAARLPSLGLDGLESALTNPLGVLTGGSRVNERHRSVRAAVDWSYGLLELEDQTVLRQTSVFAAPFTAEAAAAVVDSTDGILGVADALAQLTDHSLLVVLAEPGGTRYRMLETIRQYGTERLEERHELDAVRARHLAWCLTTAAALDGDTAAAGFAGSVDDLRAALGWAAGQPERRTEARGLALHLARLTYARGLAGEAQLRYELAAELASEPGETVRILRLAADVAMSRLSGDDALRLRREMAAVAREAGDNAGAAIDLARAAELIDRTPGLLTVPVGDDEVAALLDQARDLAGDELHVQAAILTVDAGRGALEDDPEAFARSEHAAQLARDAGDVRLESAALDQQTVILLAGGEVRAAADCARQRLELLAPVIPEAGLAFELSDALHMAALTSIGAGDLAAARTYGQRRIALAFHQEEDHLVVNWLLVRAAFAGDFDEAVQLSERFRAGWTRVGRLPPGAAFGAAPAAAAMVAGLRGDDEARAEWLDIFETILRARVDPAWGTAYIKVFDAIVALHRGDSDGALAELAGDPESLNEWNSGVWRQWYAGLWAEAGVLGGTPDAADRLTRARSMTAQNPIAGALVDRAEALASKDKASLDLPTIAEALSQAGCPYQQARTLVLAGGEHQVEGEALLASMHAMPMPV